ncbi:MAG: nuclear transport factor 2 family protein [Promethearchaeota archaeon]
MVIYMEMKDIITFCQNWLTTWTGNNPEKLISFYSKTAYYQDPANPKGLKGHDRIFPYFKKLLSANPKWIWRMTEAYSTEKGFILKWRATIPIKSEEITVFGMDILELKGDKIIRNEVYFDRTELISLLKSRK